MYLELSSKSFRTGLALNLNSMLQWCTPLKGYSRRSVQQHWYAQTALPVSRVLDQT